MNISINLNRQHSPDIDVYPVGWLKALKLARHMPAQRTAKLRQELRYNLTQLRRRNFRAVKNSFNGYLAEHRHLGTRAGHGWTKRRALRDLYRHLAEVTQR